MGIETDCAEKVTETLEALELSEYREYHPASLSGGQKQRVTIGTAIVKDSPVIYFDEPTSGLDYDSMVRVSHLIEQLASAGVIIFSCPMTLNLLPALVQKFYSLTIRIQSGIRC